MLGQTGLDPHKIATELKEIRIPFTGCEIEIEADLTEEHSIVFSEIRIKYLLFGKDLSRDEVKKNSPILYAIEYVKEK